MNLPSLRQLQYFCAVVELNHFGKAAERCFVTQSTLSVGIQELEGQLGVQLFERNKRKVMTTRIGLQLYDKAEQLLMDAMALAELAEGDKTLLKGTLRLGCIPTISPFLLPQVLPRVRQAFPELELYLIEAQTSECLQRLQKGELDVAILALPYDIGGMCSHTFWSEKFYAAMPADHPLAVNEAIHSKDLPADALLLLEEGHCLRDQVLSVCQLNTTNTQTFQGTSLYTLLEMVAGGQGMTLVPAMALQSELMAQKAIRYVPLKDKGPHREISIVWRPTLPRGKEMMQLAEAMELALKQVDSESGT